jgi:tRNA (mo5U34)-methyltransferase
MIDYSSFLDYVRNSNLEPWAKTLPRDIERGLSTRRYGDLPDWYSALADLPTAVARHSGFAHAVTVGAAEDVSNEQQATIRQALEALIPWRKGPYSVCGIEIDTEWRSDWKWDRLAPHIAPLDGKQVLDVGCGNGYHCWRMFGAGAERVVGIDPSPRFVVQFYMLKRLLIDNPPVDVLPVGIEKLPAKLQAFDTTFSMGVLYHRRSPMDHLRELHETLKPGGELVLETLVIDGGLGEVLVPEGRYAMMNNVWFLPSYPTLQSWLVKNGFEDVRCVDESVTTTDEQRATDWMRFHSLENFLDPDDPTRTAEGHPAPKRAIFVARKPK